MWKIIRVAVLLMILIVVAANAWRDKNQDWSKPVIVLLHPINSDHQASTQKYIDELSVDDFSDANKFLMEQSKQYRDQPVSVYIQLGRELLKAPPKVPENGNFLDNMLWSLKFKWYAWRQHERADGSPTVTLYLNYYDMNTTTVLKHSTALEIGKVGSVNLFAASEQDDQNNIILTHELLHAFGAKDKYDYLTGQPRYPLGYANPNQKPLYPQTQAELMAGHIAISAMENVMPNYLGQVIVNQTTASEIGWTKR
ncbi:hypothetical protein [Acinetobacter shaoyimingii]|uniref:Uncharacterized protein n=1 Tax=Acinetobacter shaoyimingii TaxID=2715164 RepID=A0A6G8RT19_9GAMM|nr:hypothetical protein [Acinetobacter shaoyimingii]QIO04938.1 hypothetical protein G8E00_02615 [Acinetobacter shaoyimingii]